MPSFLFFGHLSYLAYIFYLCQEAHILKNVKIFSLKQQDEIFGFILLHFTYKITEGNCSFVLTTSYPDVADGGDS